MSLYENLGVGRDASFEEIRRAYRKLVKGSHPDHGGDRETFERIQNAYDVLGDAERRVRYDETGETAFGPDNRLAELSATIIGAFDMVLSRAGAQFREHDLIRHTCNTLLNQKRGIRNAIAEAKKSKAELDEVVDRLKFAGSGPDIIVSTLRQRIRHHESGIVAAEREAALIDEAIGYLRSYGFDWNQPDRNALPPMVSDHEIFTFEGMTDPDD